MEVTKIISRISVLMIFLIFIMHGTVKAEQNTKQDHDDLRNLLVQVASAINNNKLDDLDEYVDANKLVVVTGDGQIFNNVSDLKKYWRSLTVGSSHIKKISIDPKPVTFTDFLAPDVGVAVGTSLDQYEFDNGKVKSMKMLWTVVVKKDHNKWKVAKIHYSGNLMDNLVLDFNKRNVIGKLFW